MKFYVYAYYEPEHAQPFYIGKGHDRRAWDHLMPCFYTRVSRLYNKIRQLLKDGYIPDIQILEDNLSEQDAFTLECKLIRQYGRVSNGTGCLLNETEGGEGIRGLVRSERQRKSVGERSKGNKYCVGRISTQRRPIVSKFGPTIVKRYQCIKQVKEDGFSPAFVGNVLKGRKKWAYGLDWEYAT